MKRKLKIMGVALMACAVSMVLVACGSSNNTARATVNWFAPMFSMTTEENENFKIWNGSDFVHLATGVITGENANISEEQLVAGGAIKTTVSLAYQGTEEYNIQFRIQVDEFSGHSITRYAVPAAKSGEGIAANTIPNQVAVLWKDPVTGNWHNIRPSPAALGGANTGGELTPPWVRPEGHAQAGQQFVRTFTINKDTAHLYANIELFIVVLEQVEFTQAAHYQAGYVVTVRAEQPDWDGHFHGFNVLASASTAIITNDDRN